MSHQEILEKAIQKAIDGGYSQDSAIRPVEGYEDRYWVDADGNVIGRRGVVVPYLDRKGYWRVTLNKKVNGKWKGQQTLVHRLIMKSFVPNPYGKPQVNHKNGNRADNRLQNLEWATAQENVVHGWSNGRVAWNKHLKSTQNMTLEDLARELPRLQEIAKALWGENKYYIFDGEINRRAPRNAKNKLETCEECGCEETPMPLWQHHLQQMVIAEDPIEYLGQNL